MISFILPLIHKDIKALAFLKCFICYFPVDLSSAMTAEALQPILTNEEFVNQLRPYLPSTAEGLPPTEQLRGTVTSPQFQQVTDHLYNKDYKRASDVH